MDNEPKHSAKLVTKWLQGNKVNVFELPSQRPDLSPLGKKAELKIHVTKAASKLDYSSIRRNGPKFKQTIVRNLWKNTQND